MRALLVRWLKLPDRPTPPQGSDESLEIFRASKQFLYYTYLKWGVGQCMTVLGILIPLAAFGTFSFERYLPFDPTDIVTRIVERRTGGDVEEIRGVTGPVVNLIQRIELFALGILLLQTIVTGTLIKLRWERRWYMLTNTAVRIHKGLFNLHEQTLTLAKIQNLRIRQGPLQRWFGIADLEIETAGGGATGSDRNQGGRATHVGRFEGLDNVAEVRTRIRQSLATAQGDAIVGQPDRAPQGVLGSGPEPVAYPQAAVVDEVRAAIDGLLAETKKFRTAIDRRGG